MGRRRRAALLGPTYPFVRGPTTASRLTLKYRPTHVATPEQYAPSPSQFVRAGVPPLSQTNAVATAGLSHDNSTASFVLTCVGKASRPSPDTFSSFGFIMRELSAWCSPVLTSSGLRPDALFLWRERCSVRISETERATCLQTGH